MPLSSKKSHRLRPANKVDEKRRYQDTMRYGLMLRPDKRSTPKEVRERTE